MHSLKPTSHVDFTRVPGRCQRFLGSTSVIKVLITYLNFLKGVKCVSLHHQKQGGWNLAPLDGHLHTEQMQVHDLFLRCDSFIPFQTSWTATEPAQPQSIYLQVKVLVQIRTCQFRSKIHPAYSIYSGYNPVTHIIPYIRPLQGQFCVVLTPWKTLVGPHLVYVGVKVPFLYKPGSCSTLNQLIVGWRVLSFKFRLVVATILHYRIICKHVLCTCYYVFIYLYIILYI